MEGSWGGDDGFREGVRLSWRWCEEGGVVTKDDGRRRREGKRSKARDRRGVKLSKEMGMKSPSIDGSVTREGLFFVLF
jgi:hypothetical protein